jgi:transposase
MFNLTEEEIRNRLTKLRNLERLYPELQEKYERAKERIIELESALTVEREERKKDKETLSLQIEELQTMVFGKKRKNDKKRNASSYRRRVPEECEITNSKTYPIDNCPDCHHALRHIRTVIQYKEDITIPPKEVIKESIEVGFCSYCHKSHAGLQIQKQTCYLGNTIRTRVVYSTAILHLSYEKTIADIYDTFSLSISSGEIACILEREATKLLPEYQDIDKRINNDPTVHIDETGYPVQKSIQGKFGWVKTSSKSFDTLFLLGQSRGGGVAEKLYTNHDQILITDDYPVYKNLSKKHGLCYAHPKRKFRDLAESRAMEEDVQRHCKEFYERFCIFYDEVKTITTTPYDQGERREKADAMRIAIRLLCEVSSMDPKKMITLKKTFLKNTENYLLCIKEEDVPMTNNKAERSIRPIVMKRKISFGSRTDKGAYIISIILSVAYTIWWKKEGNFYQSYEAIVRKWA